MSSPDVLIFGAGIVGLSLALELRRRGLLVTVHDPGAPLGQASTAAAGMLAANDPYNPPALREIARYSASLYPGYLSRIQDLSELPVPFQTNQTQQLIGGQRVRLQEHSLDPRQLAPALLRAAQNSGVVLRHEPPIETQGAPIVVYAKGAWPSATLPVRPRKGQMLRVQLPPAASLSEVIRSEHIYVVPRTQGPQASTALLGATLEDVGFDRSIVEQNLTDLRLSAARLLPDLEDEQRYPAVEAWAGLRPATPDELPFLGEVYTEGFSTAETLRALTETRYFAATGHFRNGILLAPATAQVIADLIQGLPPAVPLGQFSPQRYATVSVP